MEKMGEQLPFSAPFLEDLQERQQQHQGRITSAEAQDGPQVVQMSAEQQQQLRQQAEEMSRRCRFGVVGQTFQQLPGKPALVVEHRFMRWLDSEEQAYQRSLVLTEEWKQLDFGWLEQNQIARLVIKNDEGRFLTNPTEDEKKEMAERIILLGHSPIETDLEGQQYRFATWKIRPGEDFQGEPTTGNSIYLRSTKGKVRCTITAIPN